MKKINLLFNKIGTFIIIFICNLILLFLCYIFFVSNTNKAYNKPQEEIIVYDTIANWDNVKNNVTLYPQDINRELEGHFIDPDTNGCFFLVMKMLGYEVDIDQYYLDFFDETDSNETSHDGKVNPEMLYQNSLIYITENQLDLSVQNISNKPQEYLLAIIENNYPVIIWYGGSNWLDSEPYVVYGKEDGIIYMYNLHTTIGVNISEFLDNYSNYAIVYGKYW